MLGSCPRFTALGRAGVNLDTHEGLDVAVAALDPGLTVLADVDEVVLPVGRKPLEEPVVVDGTRAGLTLGEEHDPLDVLGLVALEGVTDDGALLLLDPVLDVGLTVLHREVARDQSTGGSAELAIGAEHRVDVHDHGVHLLLRHLVDDGLVLLLVDRADHEQDIHGYFPSRLEGLGTRFLAWHPK